MKVFFDYFGCCELVSDSFDHTETDLLYSVEAKMVPKEDAEDPELEKILDVVQNHNLMQYADDTALDKKTFTAMMKKYVKQVRMLLKETNPSREEAFVNEMNEYIKTILKNFKDYDYYHGTCDYDAMAEKCDEMKAKAEASGKDASGLTHLQEMIVICEYVDGMKPTFHFFKDGMYTESY
ncbi:hypothetical protein WA577_000825 [Blastocystis sp. JDR]